MLPHWAPDSGLGYFCWHSHQCLNPGHNSQTYCDLCFSALIKSSDHQTSFHWKFHTEHNMLRLSDYICMCYQCLRAGEQKLGSAASSNIEFWQPLLPDSLFWVYLIHISSIFIIIIYLFRKKYKLNKFVLYQKGICITYFLRSAAYRHNLGLKLSACSHINSFCSPVWDAGLCSFPIILRQLVIFLW